LGAVDRVLWVSAALNIVALCRVAQHVIA